MTTFYVLKDPKADDGDELGLAVTDFVDADPVNRGSALECPVCHGAITMLPWLPPYRAELEFWGKEAGDIAFGTGYELLVSDRFARLFRDVGLVGLSGFEKVEIVRTRSFGKTKRIKPSGEYLVVRVALSRATVDDRASEIVRDDSSPWCDECHQGGVIKRWKRIVIEENTWGGEDLFRPRGLTGRIMASERYREFHVANRINSGLLIEASQYAHDFYPWEVKKSSG
jgi:hypothetical protein